MTSHLDLENITKKQCHEIISLIDTSSSLWIRTHDVTDEQKQHLWDLLHKLKALITQISAEEIKDEEIEEQAKEIVMRMLQHAYNEVMKEEKIQE